MQTAPFPFLLGVCFEEPSLNTQRGKVLQMQPVHLFFFLAIWFEWPSKKTQRGEVWEMQQLRCCICYSAWFERAYQTSSQKATPFCSYRAGITLPFVMIMKMWSKGQKRECFECWRKIWNRVVSTLSAFVISLFENCHIVYSQAFPWLSNIHTHMEEFTSQC